MRRAPLRLVPPADHSDEPGYRAWHAPVWGCCAVCGARGRLERHHVVLEQHVRAQGGEPWDMRNSLLLGMHCRCHRAHHSAAARIPVSALPDQAVAYAADLLGAAVGAYLSRYYSQG